MRDYGAELMVYAIFTIAIIVATIAGVIKDDKRIVEEIEELEEEKRDLAEGKILADNDGESFKCPLCGSILATTYGECRYCKMTYAQAKALKDKNSKDWDAAELCMDETEVKESKTLRCLYCDAPLFAIYERCKYCGLSHSEARQQLGLTIENCRNGR